MNRGQWYLFNWLDSFEKGDFDTIVKISQYIIQRAEVGPGNGAWFDQVTMIARESVIGRESIESVYDFAAGLYDPDAERQPGADARP